MRDCYPIVIPQVSPVAKLAMEIHTESGYQWGGGGGVSKEKRNKAKERKRMAKLRRKQGR